MSFRTSMSLECIIDVPSASDCFVLTHLIVWTVQCNIIHFSATVTVINSAHMALFGRTSTNTCIVRMSHLTMALDWTVPGTGTHVVSTNGAQYSVQLESRYQANTLSRHLGTNYQVKYRQYVFTAAEQDGRRGGMPTSPFIYYPSRMPSEFDPVN